MVLNFKNKEYVNFINLAAISSYFARAITGIDTFLFLGAGLGCIVFLYQLFFRIRLPHIAVLSLLIIYGNLYQQMSACQTIFFIIKRKSLLTPFVCSSLSWDGQTS